MGASGYRPGGVRSRMASSWGCDLLQGAVRRRSRDVRDKASVTVLSRSSVQQLRSIMSSRDQPTHGPAEALALLASTAVLTKPLGTHKRPFAEVAICALAEAGGEGRHVWGRPPESPRRRLRVGGPSSGPNRPAGVPPARPRRPPNEGCDLRQQPVQANYQGYFTTGARYRM